MDTVVETKVARTHRPVSVWLTFGVLLFLGLTAVPGGVELTFGIWGANLLPGDALDRIPVIDSWVVPGLVLGIGFGIGSLFTAYGLLRRPRWRRLGRVAGHHWSWAATIAIGLGHVVWILLELIYLAGVSPLEVLYGVVGAALVLLPLLGPVRSYLATGW